MARALYINPASEALIRATGRDPGRLLTEVLWDVYPELIGTKNQLEFIRATAEHRTITYEERSPVDNRWYETRIVPTRDGTVVFNRDITERYDAEAERSQLAAIVETSEDAILSKNLDGIILSWNGGAMRLFGYEAHEVIGQSILILIPPELQHEEPHLLARLRRGERIEHYETVRRRKDGALVDISLSVSPVRGRSGEITGVAKIARDITAQKRMAREFAHLYAAEQEARKVVEAANRAKIDFLATMSHELRTPLNAIAGYVELLLLEVRGPVTEQQREDLSRIQRSRQHLLGLINDVLNFVRVDRNQVHYEIRDISVNDALQHVEELVLPQLQSKGLSYSRSPCDRALGVRADAEKVRQILVNLLGNAIKFTEPGGRIGVRCETDAEFVRILVRDTGIGIPPERLADIFEPFVQVGRQLNTTTEGIGLGLAISHELARAMHGELRVESQLGVGSTFTLVLPRGSSGE